MRTDFDFRRTVTALTLCAAGLPLTALLAWMTYIVRDWHDDVYHLALGAEALLGIVLVSLGFAVSMRAISMKGFGADFSASGGEDDDAPPAAKVTTTTETTVSAPEISP